MMTERMKKTLRVISVLLLTFGMMSRSILTVQADNKIITAVEEKVVRETTVYVGEIFVDGQSTMQYLYSPDLTNDQQVFRNLKDALIGTVFAGLVPTAGNSIYDSATPDNYTKAKKGLAVSSAHQTEMNGEWKSSRYVAGKYYTGTVGGETNGNLYDLNESYKNRINKMNEEISQSYDNHSSIDSTKRMDSTLSTTTDFVWVNHDGVLVKEYTVTASTELTTVIYTSVNVTSDTANNSETATTAETNNGEGKTTGEETQSQVTAQPAEEKITISKKPTIKKPKAAKGKITVSWNAFKTKGKKNKAIWKKIKKIEVQCSTKKNFPDDETKKKTVGKTKKSVKFTGLKKKTTYFVRVRYCDGAGGYSKWSAIKKIKTK